MAVPQSLLHARDRYLAKGIPPGGAVALPSVLYYESKLNPGSQGYQSTEHGGVLNPHGAYGIASWNGPRQAALLAYAYRLPVDHLDTQLDFVLSEIANNYPKSWAAIRSSASYKSIIPIIVDEYENPKDKQKEIDAAMVIAAALAAVPEGQPAPPVPGPEAPVPQPPPIVLPVPTAPPGLPPISAMEAGLDAAILDNIGAWRDALLQQRAALDIRIAALETAAADFGKLSPMIIPMVLPKPAVDPAATSKPSTPQRSLSVFGKSWITSVFGVGSIASAIASIGIDVVNKQTPDWAQLFLALSTTLGGTGLLAAKDKNVTGGTVPATLEATTRATSQPIA